MSLCTVKTIKTFKGNFLAKVNTVMINEVDKYFQLANAKTRVLISLEDTHQQTSSIAELTSHQLSQKDAKGILCHYEHY